MKKVVIQGLGFVGAAMATAIANVKNEMNNNIFDVIGIDAPTNQGKDRIDKINHGIFPFKVNDMELINKLQQCVKSGNLKATTKKKYFKYADVIIICINCDLYKKNDNAVIGLDLFINGVKEVIKYISKDTLIIIETTVPPGTCEKIIYPLILKTLSNRKIEPKSVYLAHSYERVMPGENYINSIINYWHVYAGINIESANKCEEFLSKIVNINKYPLKRLQSTTASEIGKLLENSYRAINIAFIEEWSRFAEDVSVDLYEIIDAIRMRPTHSNIRQPGFGVGGYCLTKDPLFAKIAAKQIFNLKGHKFPFSSLAIEVNSKMPLVTLDKIKRYYKGSIKNKKILLLGISYKKDVGDTRYSPSEIFFNEAKKLGAYITAHDPLVDYWQETGVNVSLKLPSMNEYDVAVFAVPHKVYSEIDFRLWVSDGHECLLFDANHVLSKKQIEDISSKCCHFLSIGKG